MAVRLTTLPPHACAYLPGRATTVRAFVAASIDGPSYQGLLDANFRRSGRMIYQPVCAGCRACRSIRVAVDRFAPSRSQRRSVARNADLTVIARTPEPSEAKYAMYRDYSARWHAEAEVASAEAFVGFLYDSPATTIEFEYRDRDRLVGVGICDVTGASLSSVYFYFDPDAAGRSLGTFSAMREIAYARDAGLTHYHLGYWVDGCAAMAYKANFRPAELLGTDGVWRPMTTSEVQ